jgi:hypothetical protein
MSCGCAKCPLVGTRKRTRYSITMCAFCPGSFRSAIEPNRAAGARPNGLRPVGETWYFQTGIELPAHRELDPTQGGAGVSRRGGRDSEGLKFLDWLSVLICALRSSFADSLVTHAANHYPKKNRKCKVPTRERGPYIGANSFVLGKTLFSSTNVE